MQKAQLSRDYRLFLGQLRQARLKAGLTQKDLAERLNITQSALSKIERGERRIDIVELRALCIAIGMPFLAFVRQFDRSLLGKGDD